MAELAKKPKLQVVVDKIPLGTNFRQSLPTRELTSTKAVFEVLVKNNGDASTKAFHFKVGTDIAGVRLSADVPFSDLNLPSDISAKAITIPVDNILCWSMDSIQSNSRIPEYREIFHLGVFRKGEKIASENFGGIEIKTPVSAVGK